MELDEGEIVDEGESLLTNGSDSKLAEEKPTTEPQPAEPSNNGVDEPEEGELTEEGELVEDDMPRRSRSPSLRFGSQGGQTPGLPTPEVLDTPSRAETVVEVDRGPSLQETIARYKGLDSYDDYEPNEKVGQGTFGEVVVARHKRTHEKVALKRIIVHKKHEGLPITSVREIIILKALHHENIIRLNSLAFSKGNEAEYEPAQIYMVFPYMDHDLYGLLKNAQVMLYPAQIKSFAKQMLDGLNYLHTNRMLHRDMKSANILVDDRGHLTIGDFGLARRHVTYGNSVTTLTPTVVTLWYRPPEILLEEKKYNSAVDMWGFGCIFAEMWDRHPLFQVGTEALALDKIFTVCGTPNAIDWPSFPSILERQKLEPRKETRKVREMYRPDRFDFHTINFLDALLKVNPAKRLTAKEALAHEYFQVEPLPAQPGTIDFPGWPESHEMAIQERLNGERERAHQNARRRGEATPRYESNLPLHGDVLLIQGVPTPRRPLPVSDRVCHLLPSDGTTIDTAPAIRVVRRTDITIPRKIAGKTVVDDRTTTLENTIGMRGITIPLIDAVTATTTESEGHQSTGSDHFIEIEAEAPTQVETGVETGMAGPTGMQADPLMIEEIRGGTLTSRPRGGLRRHRREHPHGVLRRLDRVSLMIEAITLRRPNQQPANHQPPQITIAPMSASVAINNLRAYTPHADVYGRDRRAAVLVGLVYDSNTISITDVLSAKDDVVPRDSQLDVWLTLRSSKMRSHAGEVALPGGRYETDDETLISTALREAEEEIGLQQESVESVTCLPPFPSKNLLLVTPVIGIVPRGFIPTPNPAEVSACFTAPLKMFLSDRNHKFTDVVRFDGVYRLHVFELTVGSVTFRISGLTADILISVAEIAYQQAPEFEALAPGQPPVGEIVAHVVSKTGAESRL
ncbi:kinase-like domain-containing protein [Fimicolochytrium jonesii]|uniref:kinase-like domain-containing protein n=1 Tax=Fimicolochytrium jonesii TaxID=1396493 RepID=UPI0022FE49E4|nr:kinase-like domain-containing protein [Fimicolochytrium jonesii]KAI8815654.1 kinase-like domain-containing protein [Fimicolochytrium jonesii]